MASGAIGKQKLNRQEQFLAVDDLKLRMTLTALADKYDAFAREFVYKTYQDNQLASIYRGIRQSGDFDLGGKTKVRRELIRFPNAYVYEFCNTVFSAMYGRNWLDDKKLYKHELLAPWLVVHPSKI